MICSKLHARSRKQLLPIASPYSLPNTIRDGRLDQTPQSNIACTPVHLSAGTYLGGLTEIHGLGKDLEFLW